MPLYCRKTLDFDPKDQMYLTPPHIKDLYSEWFDPCPHPTPFWDGLEVECGEKTFCNPPWREIKKGEKTLEERDKGRTVHMLLAAKPTTSTFRDITFPLANEVEWLRGETHYLRVRDNKTVRLPSCIVKFDPSLSESLQ